MDDYGSDYDFSDWFSDDYGNDYIPMEGNTTPDSGDYLGLPTFGTRISSTKKLVDSPCASNSRNFTNSDLDAVMRALRSDASIPGSTCSTSLNTNGTQTIIFKKIGRAHV